MEEQRTQGGEEPSSPSRSTQADDRPRNQILVGDVHDWLPKLADASVDCVITSPPYFATRDYQHDRQIGIERRVTDWVSELHTVCRQLARIVRPRGSLWLNLGDSYSRHEREGAGRKSLLLGPQRLALALINDGWLLRNQVIWAKSNPMPSSVTDRLSATHEVVYFFTRSHAYYLDLDAIREPLVTTRRQTTSDPMRAYPPPDSGTPRQIRGCNDNRGLSRLKAAGLAGHPLGKNPGDVWTLPTAGYRGAHFAAYPGKLVERPLLASCPAQVCAACDEPWRRTRRPWHGRHLATGEPRPACHCDAEARPGIVLDPFLGTGTTALVAAQHGRDWLGIELNPTYVALANQRLSAQRTHAGTADPSTAADPAA